MNRYNNFIRFVREGTSLNRPDKLNTLPARAGDFYRLLVPKADIGIPLMHASVGLRSFSCHQQPEMEDIGLFRHQQPEQYTYLRLAVNSLPQPGVYKQFGLMRENGQVVITTYRGQQTTLSEYMMGIKKRFESYPYALVLAEINGNILDLRIYNNSRFRLTDEPLTIGIGTVLEKNSNQPAIELQTLGTYTRGELTKYRIRVGSSIQPGNIFYLNGVSYQAIKGDTAQTILDKLNGGSDSLTVETGTLGTTTAEPGKRDVENSTKPSVVPTYDSTGGGSDYYVLRVQGSWQDGNIIQITATGKTTITRILTDNDTVSSIEADLNPDSGKYQVSAGVLPDISVLAGRQRKTNSNNPSLIAQTIEVLPEAEVRRWQVTVSDDIQSGNVYHFEGKTYIARKSDTADSIARALGLSGAYSVIERLDEEPIEVYAEAGQRWGQDDIADVQILAGPIIQPCHQAVLDLRIPELGAGIYQLLLMDRRNKAIIAEGNYLRVDEHEQSSMVEVMDSGESLGYEYLEEGLSQRLRLPVAVQTVTPFVESESRLGLDGVFRKKTVRMTRQADLVSGPLTSESVDVLATWLHHDSVVIEGKLYNTNGIDTPVLSEHSQTLQLIAKLSESGNERHNRGRTMNTIEMGYGRIELVPPEYGLKIWVIDQGYRPLTREISLRAGEYELLLRGGSDDYTLRIYVNGEAAAVLAVPKYERSRYAFVRVPSHGLTTLVVEHGVAPDVTYICHEATDAEVDYTCEKVTHVGAEFSDDYGEDFAV